MIVLVVVDVNQSIFTKIYMYTIAKSNFCIFVPSDLDL